MSPSTKEMKARPPVRGGESVILSGQACQVSITLWFSAGPGFNLFAPFSHFAFQNACATRCVEIFTSLF